MSNFTSLKVRPPPPPHRRRRRRPRRMFVSSHPLKGNRPRRLGLIRCANENRLGNHGCFG